MSGLKDIVTPQKVCEDESLFDFVSRRFGNHVAKFAIDPMVRGICAGNAKEISAKAFVAGPLFELEQEYGGIFKGMFIFHANSLKQAFLSFGAWQGAGHMFFMMTN